MIITQRNRSLTAGVTLGDNELGKAHLFYGGCLAIHWGLRLLLAFVYNACIASVANIIPIWLLRICTQKEYEISKRVKKNKNIHQRWR